MSRIILLVLLVLLASACSTVRLEQKPEATITAPIIASDVLTTRTLNSSHGKLPDSTHILFGTENSQLQLWVIDMATKQRRQLKGYQLSYSGIKLLADGFHLISPGNHPDEVFLGDIKGSAAKVIKLDDTLLQNFQPYTPLWCNFYGYAHGLCLADYQFSPDGRYGIYWYQGDTEVILLDRSINEKKALFQMDKQDSFYGAWTPDGQWYLFTFDYGSTETYYGRLGKISVDKWEVQYLTEGYEGINFSDPVLSPDGEKIAYSVSSRFTDSLGVYWMKGGQVRFFPIGDQLKAGAISGNNMIWSPDSRQIAFIHGWYKTDISFLDIETGEIEPLTDDDLVEFIMDWQ